jgi:hypothetical protein
MHIRRFGRFLSVIVEPDPADGAGPDGAEAEPSAGDPVGPWFDYWTSHGGWFVRFGRLLVVYSLPPSGASQVT